MKKGISLFLTLALFLCLSACNGGDQNRATEGQENTPSVVIPKELSEQISGDWAVVNPYDGAPNIINIHDGILLTLDDLKYDMKYEGENIFSVWLDGMNIGNVTLCSEMNGNISLEFEIAGVGAQPSFKDTCYKLEYDYTETIQTETSKVDLIAQNPLLPYVAGRMVSYCGDTEEVPAEILVNDNGTCIINEKEMTWQVEGTNEYDVLRLCVYEGEILQHRLAYCTDSTGVVVMNLENADGGTIGNYLSLNYYEIIEVTTDNWMEYFEIDERASFSFNAFGDFEEFRLTYWLREKEGYAIERRLSRIDIEVQHSLECRKLVLNLDNQTYELGEFTTNNNTLTTQILYMYNPEFSDNPNGYGCCIDYYTTRELENNSFGYLNEFDVLRIQGSLYIIKTT